MANFFRNFENLNEAIKTIFLNVDICKKILSGRTFREKLKHEDMTDRITVNVPRYMLLN